jgi:hypothetical protein
MRTVGPARRIVVFQVRDVNWFYQDCAERLAKALTLSGARVVLASASEPPAGVFDVGLVVGLGETAHACGEENLIANLQEFGGRCAVVAAVTLESPQTHWFGREIQLFQRLGLERLVEMNVYSKKDSIADPSVYYSFLPYGLLPDERAAARRHLENPGQRRIPWVTIGFTTVERTQLAASLVREVDPRGFIYLSTLSPVRDDGHHLGPRQIARILEQSAFYVWRSHHPHFYLEGERYRQAAIHGCVPIKVVDALPDERHLPFPYSIVPLDQIAALADPQYAAELRERFLSEYLSWPGLEKSVDTLLGEIAPTFMSRELAA